MLSNALNWLNDLIQWFGKLIPRIVLIHPTHRGVRFGPSGKAVMVGPGVVVYWPIIFDLVQIPITTISYQSPGQVLPVESTSMIPQIVACATAVQFRIEDPVLAATKALNFHAITDNRVQAAVARHWNGNVEDRSWCEAALQEVRQVLEPYGIHIERLDVCQVGRGCTIKYISDWAYSDNVNGTRPT